MLKIRISGTRKELEQISKVMEDADIKTYRHKSGKTTFAIDSKISVKDFLAKNTEPDPSTLTHEQNLKKVTDDLNELLDVIND